MEKNAKRDRQSLGLWFHTGVVCVARTPQKGELFLVVALEILRHNPKLPKSWVAGLLGQSS
jgi:hypothetical protein